MCCPFVTATSTCVCVLVIGDRGVRAVVFPWNCDSNSKYQSFDLTQERSPTLNPCLPSDSPTQRHSEVYRGKPQRPVDSWGCRGTADERPGSGSVLHKCSPYVQMTQHFIIFMYRQELKICCQNSREVIESWSLWHCGQALVHSYAAGETWIAPVGTAQGRWGTFTFHTNY